MDNNTNGMNTLENESRGLSKKGLAILLGVIFCVLIGIPLFYLALINSSFFAVGMPGYVGHMILRASLTIVGFCMVLFVIINNHMAAKDPHGPNLVDYWNNKVNQKFQYVIFEDDSELVDTRPDHKSFYLGKKKKGVIAILGSVSILFGGWRFITGLGDIRYIDAPKVMVLSHLAFND